MRSASPLEDRGEYNCILVLNRKLWGYPKPTIAAVHGFAMGAGANLMSWCDMAVADEDTRIGYPEVRCWRPVRHRDTHPDADRRPQAHVRADPDGEPITAAEAERIGLVNRVVAAARC